MAALKEGDAEAACEVLTRGAVAELEASTQADCPEALAEAVGIAGAADEELEDLRVTEVNAAGTVATAKIVGGPGGTLTSELQREQGEWGVANPGG